MTSFKEGGNFKYTGMERAQIKGKPNSKTELQSEGTSSVKKDSLIGMPAPFLGGSGECGGRPLRGH